MAPPSTLFLSCFLTFSFLFHCTSAARTPAALAAAEELTLSYHKGPLLTGPISVNLIWYGRFTPAHRSIVSDFVTSLSSKKTTTPNSVAAWWSTVEKLYYHRRPTPTLTLGDQVLDESCSLGKSLTDTDLLKLAARGRSRYAINVVLTADDVAVEGFCMSRCGTHGSSSRSRNGRFAYIWVGNSAVQCPGQCAWPFHQPIYGPQTPPLVAPNGDVGADGMVVNLAGLVAGVATNPFGDGYYQGAREAPLEAATACPGVYAKGAYPGYAGDLLVDGDTGASYNANGVNRRKYLLPAIYNPLTSSCSTLV